MKSVGLRTKRTHQSGKLDKPFHVVLESFPKPIATSHRIHNYTELRQQIYHEPPPWRRAVIAQRPPSFFTRVKQLAPIILVLGILIWIWFGVLAYHAPRSSDPYYDKQNPVPQSSELTPLKGNHERRGEYR